MTIMVDHLQFSYLEARINYQHFASNDMYICVCAIKNNIL